MLHSKQQAARRICLRCERGLACGEMAIANLPGTAIAVAVAIANLRRGAVRVAAAGGGR